MIKNLPAALVAVSLFAVAQPALAQVLTAGQPVTNLAVVIKSFTPGSIYFTNGAYISFSTRASYNGGKKITVDGRWAAQHELIVKVGMRCTLNGGRVLAGQGAGVTAIVDPMSLACYSK